MALSPKSPVTAPARLSAQPAACRPSTRRQFVKQVLRFGAVPTPASILGSPLSHHDLGNNVLALPDQQQALERGKHRAAAPATASASGLLVGAAPAAGPARGSSSSNVAPRVLEMHNTAELTHLLACHPNRLIVVHFVAAGCPLGEAFFPALVEACRQHPGPLFLRVTVPREQAAASADRELLAGLKLGRLPCTLLLRGRQLLARLEVGNGSDSQPTAEAAQEAGRTLLAAVAAALAPGGAAEPALAPAGITHDRSAAM